MKQFRKILVANRGEIAVRVMRTCREMGIIPIAVYSDADRNAVHVKCADEAYCIGEAPSRDSYLRSDRILAAAEQSRADAIHPGYGFLSENEGFARQCGEAGVVFIGPSPESIRLMGSKIAAKQLMKEQDVPVVPGYDGEDQSLENLRARAIDIGFPVMIKASAGGGGKGMRVVRGETQLDDAIEAARREAQSAFGDGTVLLERYIDSPRHIEFQILGDQHGKLLHLFERECSIQRRHQKILEESPSPAVSAELRSKMAEAALRAGRAIRYFNAGTVEFIVDPTGQFYFLEVNTRLQVEHPVTELVTGLDLVRLQIEIAQGLPLDLEQHELKQRGHAMEARVYAEDPASNLLPATGILLAWDFPRLEGIRIDAGVEQGSEVGIHYDPMLAKVIAHSPRREETCRKLAYALKNARIHGVVTNRDFLVKLLEHARYLAGDIHTHFIEEHLPLSARQEIPDSDSNLICVVAASVWHLSHQKPANEWLPQVPNGWRNNRFRDDSMTWMVEEATFELSYRRLRPGRYRFVSGFHFFDVTVCEVEMESIRVEINSVQRRFRVNVEGECLWIDYAGGRCRVSAVSRFPEVEPARDPGDTTAPMPGRVLKVRVSEGQTVDVGSALVTLEAMKMEHTLTAPTAGVVASVFVHEGELVEAGARLIHIAAHEGVLNTTREA